MKVTMRIEPLDLEHGFEGDHFELRFDADDPQALAEELRRDPEKAPALWEVCRGVLHLYDYIIAYGATVGGV